MTRTLQAVGLTVGLFFTLASSAFAWHGDLTCQRLHIVGTPDHTDWIQNGHNYSDREITGAWEQDYKVPTPPGYGPVTVHVVPKGDKPYTLTTTESCGVKPPVATPTPTPVPPVPTPVPPHVTPPPVPPPPHTFKMVPKRVVAKLKVVNHDPPRGMAHIARNGYWLTARCVPSCPNGPFHVATRLVLRVHGKGPIHQKRWFVDGHRIRSTSLVHVYAREVVAWFYDTAFWAPGLTGSAAWQQLYGVHRFVFRGTHNVKVRA